jgi:hypothetical protein
MRVVLIAVLLAAAVAGQDRLPPVDESTSDPSFLAFKVRLLAALERKDVAALMRALDPKIRVSFGAGDGIATFRKHWHLDRPAQSKVWTELATVLRLGATRDETEFIAPYVFTRFPQTLDAYNHAAVIRPAAILRKSPSLTAPKIATLDHSIVVLLGQPGNGWRQVRTPDGVTGWLQERDLRSPLDYRAFFEKRNEEWRLTAFTRGD